MLGYLKKFNDLPAGLKQKVSGKAVMATIEGLEKQYKVSLAALIMKVMVKEVSLSGLAGYLVGENLSAGQAERLAGEMKEKIFSILSDNFSPQAPVPLELEQDEEIKFEIKALAEADKQAEVKGASFFFSPDDEAEIRELAKKIGLVEKVALSSGEIEEKLGEIISQAKINFGSADLAARFSQILRTYFRGIRNRPEAKATLVKPFLSGGLNFDEDSAEQVMVLADKVARPAKPRAEAGKRTPSNVAGPKPEEILKPLPKLRGLGKTAETPLKAIARDVDYDFSKLAKKSVLAAASGGQEPSIKSFTPGKPDRLRLEDTSHELAPLTPAVAAKAAPIREPAAAVKESRPKTVAPIIEKAPLSRANKPEPAGGAPSPLIKRRFEAENLSQSQKVKVEDVKYVPRVMGPLDEIKYMDLINFRRLGQEPAATAEKIKNKINLLEEDGYGKKLEAIKAWRSSPINKLYLEIGHLSISGNKPINVIIEERKAKGEDYLADGEFKAIMDLNKSLRF